MRNCVREPAKREQSGADLILILRRGLERGRAPAAGKRRFEPALIAQRISETRMRLGVAGVEADRFFELRRSIGGPPERRECEPEVVVEGRKGLARNGAADQADRFLMLATL